MWVLLICVRYLAHFHTLVPIARAVADAVREAALDVLRTPSYRAAASRLRAEIAELPGPEHGVKLLERLAASRAPNSGPA